MTQQTETVVNRIYGVTAEATRAMVDSTYAVSNSSLQFARAWFEILGSSQAANREILSRLVKQSQEAQTLLQQSFLESVRTSGEVVTGAAQEQINETVQSVNEAQEQVLDGAKRAERAAKRAQDALNSLDKIIKQVNDGAQRAETAAKRAQDVTTQVERVARRVNDAAKRSEAAAERAQSEDHGDDASDRNPHAAANTPPESTASAGETPAVEAQA